RFDKGHPVAGWPASRVSGSADYDFFSGSSFFLSLPLFYWLHCLALTSAGVFHTTLNWPSAFTSPMNTGLCRWWFFASIVDVKPPGAGEGWPARAATPLSVSCSLALSR